MLEPPARSRKFFSFSANVRYEGSSIQVRADGEVQAFEDSSLADILQAAQESITAMHPNGRIIPESFSIRETGRRNR